MASGFGATIRRKREKVSNLEAMPSLLAAERRKPKVWNYYTKLGDSYVECNMCRKQLAFHHNTSSMREHLVRRHSIHASAAAFSQIKEEPELDFPDPEGAPKRLRPTPNNSLCQSESEARAEVIAELVLEMIYTDLHPLSVVEDKGFGILLGYLDPGLGLPSPMQLSGMLWHRYSLVKQQLKSLLQSAHSIVLSIESWTAHPRQPCQTITAVIIDSDWRLSRYILGTHPLYQSKDEVSLPQRLYSVLLEFGLSNKVVTCVVHDCYQSLAAYDHVLKDTRGWASLCCAANVLQLCARAGLEVQEVREALGTARGLVSHFEQDLKASCSLNAKLEAMNKPRLVLDTDWCWITTLEMCESLLDLKWAIHSILEEQAVQNLAEKHWKLLQDLVPMLKTLWIATSFLQEEQNISVSALMPCVHGVLTAVAQLSAESNDIIKAVAGQIRSEICRHWDMMDEEKLLTNPAVIASFLDPRFKELTFLKSRVRGELHTRVRNVLLQTCKPGDSPCSLLSCRLKSEEDSSYQPPVSKDTIGCATPDDLYDFLLGKDPTEGMPEVHQQLENYIVEPICKRSTDPLIWWKTNHPRFPALAKLARQYLAIPTTAVHPEHAFSAKQSVLDQRRAALELKFVDQVMFLHQNLNLYEMAKKINE
ncbi:E3 SUMO-protein ligase ZBED1-like [Rhinophrynus dorsalis]